MESPQDISDRIVTIASQFGPEEAVAVIELAASKLRLLQAISARLKRDSATTRVRIRNQEETREIGPGVGSF